MKDFEDQIWAYLHNELPSDQRERFEQALTNDDSLRESLEECRAMHQDLDRLSDHRLEDRLLAEWEAEHPEYREDQKRHRSRIIPFRLSLTAAAAAAAIILLIALPGENGPVQWECTIYGIGPQLRGHVDTQARYTPTDLEHMNEMLQNTIESSIGKLPNPPAPWKLQIQLQELGNGYLAVEVSGHPQGQPARSVTWEATIKAQDGFAEEASRLGQRIASEIAGPEAP